MNFIKTFLASLLAFIVANIILGIFTVLLLVSMATAFSSRPSQVKPDSILIIDLAHGISDAPRSTVGSLTLNGFQLDNRQSMYDVLRAVANAAYDSNIKGIFLNVELANVSLAHLEELRQALDRFRKESGKFIISYGNNYDQRAYYFSSVSDRLYLNPHGFIEWKGVAAGVMFYKGLLDKLEIKPEIIRLGTFKSAVEPFILDKMSPENRLQMQTYVDGSWQTLLNDISASREIAPSTLSSYADRYVLMEPNDALRLGMVDDLLYEDQVAVLLSKLSRISNVTAATIDSQVNAIKSGTDQASYISVQADLVEQLIDEEMGGIQPTQDVTVAENRTIDAVRAEKPEKPRLVTLTDYIGNSANYPRGRSRNRIAVIYIEGDIVGGEATDGNAGAVTVSERLKRARLDDRVKAAVVRVNSPGGDALASEVMWREIELLRAQKPVIVSMGPLAASGGYYVSCPGDVVLANRLTLTGSIGVFGMFFNLEDALRNKLGLTAEFVTTNPYSDFGSGLRPLQAREREVLQRHVESVYATFTDRVSRGRNLSVSRVDEIGQGRIWTGVSAREIGLVDGFGGLIDAIELAADRAGIPGDYRVWEIVDEPDSFSLLIRSLAAEAGVKENSELEQWVRHAEQIRRIVGEEGVVARMPYTIEIQ